MDNKIDKNKVPHREPDRREVPERDPKPNEPMKKAPTDEQTRKQGYVRTSEQVGREAGEDVPPTPAERV